MGSFCGRCGSLLVDGAALCGRCGAPAAAHQSPSAAALAGAGVPAGLATSAPVQVGGAGRPSGMEQFDGLQRKVLAQGDAIAQTFGDEPTGFVKDVAWMVRATCLDKRVARAAAQDTDGNGAALLALALISLPGIILAALISIMRVNFAVGLVLAAVVTAVTWVITFLTLSAASAKIVEVKLSASTLLRVMAYPQTITVVGSIPILGGFIGPVARIWSIVATAEAIREVTGAKSEKAILFAAFGALIQACAWMVLSVLAARMAMLF